MLENDHPRLIRNLINQSNDAISIVDPETSLFIYVNNKWCSNLGYSSPELLKMRVIDIDTILTDSFSWKEHVKDLRKAGSMIIESEHRRKDGTVFPVEINLKFTILNRKSFIVGIVRDITERKKAELLLRSSEERFRRLAENAQDIIYRYRLYPERGFEYISPAVTAITGYTPEEHYADPDIGLKIVYPDDLIVLKWILEDRSFRPVVLRWISKNGTIIWTEQRNIPIYDNDGKLIAIEGIARDITERKVNEDALLESEKNFRNLSENLSEMVYRADPETYASIYCNKAHERLFGYPVEEWIKNPKLWEDSIYPEDKERVLSVLEEAKKNLKGGVIEYRIIKKDKAILWIEDHFSWEVDRHGTPVSLNGVGYDITGRRRVEEYLKKSKNRFKAIFNTTSVSIFEEDFSEVKKAIDDIKASGIKDFRKYIDENPDFVSKALQMVKILDVNDAAIKLYGARDKTELLESLDKIFTPESYQAFKEGLIAIAEGKIYYEAEAFNKRLDGKLLDILITIAIPSEQSEFKNMIVSIFDITDRKKMEQDLIRMQKIESLGILSGGIAHDFNNVMTGVLGNISLAKIWAESDEKVKEILIDAENACFRAKELTQQLITFAKGGSPIKETIPIKGLIKDLTIFTLSGSNVKAKFDIPYDIWPVEVDGGQISQVINNLVLNADQAMPEGGIIEVKCENVEINKEDILPLKTGRYIRITIKDQGCGIAREHIDKIFDPYFTTKQKGSGLGLSTVYSIIKRHDGYISVESEIGLGSTFYVYLPASEKETCEKREEEKDPIYGKGRILLMDDEEIVRNAANKMLTKLGYEVELIEDGVKVVELYKAAKDSGRPFDIVIMDLTIPGGMGGKEVIIKLLEIDPYVKAIVSSGYSIDPVVSEYEKFGFKGFLTKPFNIVEIGKVVNKVLKEE